MLGENGKSCAISFRKFYLINKTKQKPQTNLISNIFNGQSTWLRTFTLGTQECPESMWFCCSINILSSFTEANSQTPVRNPVVPQHFPFANVNKSLSGAEPGASPLGSLGWGARTPWGDCREGFCARALGSFPLCQSCANSVGLKLFVHSWDSAGFYCHMRCVCVQHTHKGKKQKAAEWNSHGLSKNGSEGHSWLFYWAQYSGFPTVVRMGHWLEFGRWKHLHMLQNVSRCNQWGSAHFS